MSTVGVWCMDMGRCLIFPVTCVDVVYGYQDHEGRRDLGFNESPIPKYRKGDRSRRIWTMRGRDLGVVAA